MLAKFVLWTSLCWVVQTSLCQYILPRDSIEAIVWGEQFQWGQAKSPPLSGWIAYGFAWLSGYRDWSNYLAAQLCIVVGVFFVYRLAREFFDEAESAAAALLLFTLPYYMPPAMKFCSHDTQIALLPGIAYFYWRALKEDRLRDWLALAVVSALAMLGKYAAGQMLIGCFVVMVCSKFARKRLGSIGPYLAGIGFLLLMTPHVRWLMQNDFYPILHLEDRMEKAAPWTNVLLSLVTMIYPYLLEGAVLAAAYFIVMRKKLVPVPRRKEALWFSLALTLIPGGIYFIMAATKHGIVLNWYCYLASLTGISVLAVFPWKCTRQVFQAVLALLWIYFAILLIAVTLDVMAKPRYRIHSRPEDIAGRAAEFYREATGREIPCVYGDRWLAGVVQNYLPGRPPAVVRMDPCNIKLYDTLIREKGALLVFDQPEFLPELEKRFGRKPVQWKVYPLPCRAQFGKTKQYQISFGVLPPQEK